jgi:hypothetical protein
VQIPRGAIVFFGDCDFNPAHSNYMLVATQIVVVFVSRKDFGALHSSVTSEDIRALKIHRLACVELARRSPQLLPGGIPTRKEWTFWHAKQRDFAPAGISRPPLID